MKTPTRFPTVTSPILAAAPQSRPGSLPHMFRQAASLAARRQFTEADALYRGIVAQALADPRLLAGAGMEMIRHRRFDDAVSLLEPALRQNGGSAELHNGLGFALTGMGRLDAAIRHYKLAVRQKPVLADAHNNLAYVLQQVQRYPEALAACDQAIALRPAYPEAHNNRGNALRALGRRGEAVLAYGEALSADPAFADARRNLATGLVGLGYAGEAMTEPALPASLLEDVETLVLIGQLYLGSDNGHAALRIYERAQLLDPDNERVVYGLGRAHAQLHRFEAAARLFEGLLARGIRSGEILAQLADLPPEVVRIDLLAAFAGMRGQNDEAQGLLDFGRAVVLDRAGRHAEAWAIIEKANAVLWPSKRTARQREETREAEALARLRSSSVRGGLDAAGPCSTLVILGASRAGKTTAETLAAELPGVERGYENSLIGDCWRLTLNRHALPDDGEADDLPEPLRQTFRDSYRAATERAGRPGTTFTTTNPGLIHRVAFLAETLPGARFVLVRRDVDDTVLRMLMKSYRSGNAYAYAVEAARAHVAWYLRMIEEVARIYPDISLVLSYEAMLAAPDKALDAIAALCGLPRHDGAIARLPDDRGCARPYSACMG
ncbi:tetratricopeptide repeat-containing sulfotransferase family protein [Kaistia adipata]|uniref:tetratricopeptide repeat-containing sulfotransferase family protein n=1 Tax=Kaistia adipata TaxID=166954 RepID=UPI0004168F63|nr:tetratricopeptide repeat-containing sulfotransferase family protein [Kaistia adipata]